MKWVGCAAACAAVILTGTLAGCGSRDAAPTLTASPVVTSTKVVTATPASGKAIVQDAEKFRTANGYVFSYSTGAQGMCVFNDQQVTCQGTPESGVPKVQTSTYSASPDAITASTSGLTYGMFDHAQPDRLVPLRCCAHHHHQGNRANACNHDDHPNQHRNPHHIRAAPAQRC